MTNAFSENLTKLRKDKGLSQDDLAKKLYVSRQAISKWENGESTPDLDKLMEIAQLLDITLDGLVSNEKLEQSVESTSQEGVVDEQGDSHLNVWDFLARFWWLLFPVVGFLSSIFHLN